jgi:uncharacterized membrane protein
VIRRLAALLLAVVWPGFVWADGVERIDVDKRDNVYFVEVVVSAPVPVTVAWDVMTGYEQLPRFIPDIKESRVIARQDGRVTIEQKGVTSVGPLSWDWQSVREIELRPMERIVSRQISGKNKRSLSTTEFAGHGPATRLTYRSEMEPGYWVPDFISRSLIVSRIREHFEVMLAEMKRRHVATGAVGAVLVKVP